MQAKFGVKADFLRNPGKGFLIRQVATRYGISTSYAAKCIAEARKTINIVTTDAGDGISLYTYISKGEGA